MMVEDAEKMMVDFRGYGHHLWNWDGPKRGGFRHTGTVIVIVLSLLHGRPSGWMVSPSGTKTTAMCQCKATFYL